MFFILTERLCNYAIIFHPYKTAKSHFQDLSYAIFKFFIVIKGKLLSREQKKVI